MAKVRTRFAPSPTGRMHVGNLRTALYTYLIAKHEGGDFVLRIEDTDQERFVEEALGIIYRTLEKTGLIHDEGPDKDGGYGPYIQSERCKSGLGNRFQCSNTRCFPPNLTLHGYVPFCAPGRQSDGWRLSSFPPTPAHVLQNYCGL